MTINDPQLGTLIFDPDIGWWEGRVILASGVYLLYVHTPSESDHSVTDAARGALEKMKSSEQAARAFAAKELLPVYNSEWCEGKKIAIQEFIERLVPAAIQVWPNGDAEISYADGNLFMGHEIGVRHRGGQFTEAVIQG